MPKVQLTKDLLYRLMKAELDLQVGDWRLQLHGPDGRGPADARSAPGQARGRGRLAGAPG
ncbi:hypothetical protein LP419_16220 [Massilia sp. H-1]|nr:hypothetical protein LP419_16220 [Massilia sp. H-1]